VLPAVPCEVPRLTARELVAHGVPPAPPPPVAADVAVAAATAVVVADGVADVPLPGALAAADALLVADEADVVEVAGDDAEDDEAVPEPHAATSIERPATAVEAMARQAFLGVEFIAEFSGSPRPRNLCQMTLNVTARQGNNRARSRVPLTLLSRVLEGDEHRGEQDQRRSDPQSEAGAAGEGGPWCRRSAAPGPPGWACSRRSAARRCRTA
jgi:hypothetical protein